MKALKTHKNFNGKTQFWEHDSVTTKTKMKFATFIPDGEVRGCLIWLSGLTCTEENFITKAGAQKYLGEAGLMVIAPDTSPRGLNLPHEHDSYDFGSGASFYLDSTTPGYKDHYLMETYINSEIYNLAQTVFEQKKISIFGHSMGGHGALTIALRHPEKYVSVSAFAPSVNPTQTDWGQKAFKGYLGDDPQVFKMHDTCELLKMGKKHPSTILIHQGTEDEFLEKRLLVPNFEAAAKEVGQPCVVKYAEGYDHSYYFISTFMPEHIEFHKKALVK